MVHEAILLALCVAANGVGAGKASGAKAPAAPSGRAPASTAPAAPAAPAVPDVPLPPPPSVGQFKVRPQAAPGAKVLRVGVPEPRIVGDVSARETAVVAQALVTEVRKLDALVAVGMAEIRAVLSQEYRRQMLGCKADEECLAEIAGALGVDELVSSELVVAGDTSTFKVARIDMRTTKVRQESMRRLRRTKAGEEVLGAMGEMVAQVFPDRPLRTGESRGVAKEVGRWLNPPPLPRWVFWATVGGAAAAAAGGTAYGLASNSTRSDYNALARSGGTVNGAELQRLHDQASSQSTRATVLFGVAGGFAVAAVVEAFFTDWHNDRAAVTVTPAGAGMTLRF
jgi:hypothetical protein